MKLRPLFVSFVVLASFFYYTFGNATSGAGTTKPAENTNLPNFQTGESYSKNPFIAGTLSMIWSGGGQFYLNQNIKGGLYSINNLILTRQRLKFLDKKTSLSRFINIASNNFFDGLQVYEAYTDSFKHWNGEEVLKVPRYTISELMKAPVKLNNYSHWATLLPLAIPGIPFISRIGSAHKNVTLGKAAVNIPAILITSYLIAVGEEAMFRGFQQPLFSQITGSKTIGNILQSISFGACHTTWIYCDSPYLTGHIVTQLTTKKRSYDPTERFRSTSNKKNFWATSLFGLYAGHLHQHTKLENTITLHFLWDALLFTTDYLRTGEAPPLYITVGTKF
ncbi:MAG: CPBP family intramembrane metalloprotease [Oligoflexia bacterium]|nr:CPBP family intramembrane metalloprotease [Oligoflexia bacterium]